jgi:hypothetical protein
LRHGGNRVAKSLLQNLGGRFRVCAIVAVSMSFGLAACHNGDSVTVPQSSITSAGKPKPATRRVRTTRVPVTAVPNSIPARFMPPGGWHLVVGIGQEALISIDPSKTLSEFTLGKPSQIFPMLGGQLRLDIVSSNVLLVLGTRGIPDFYLSTDASTQHLYERDMSASGTPGTVSVTFCAGALRDAQCGA